MQKLFIYFWGVFIFYFVFVHGPIIYYAGANYSELAVTDGKKALLWLAVSVLLWLSVFIALFIIIYRNSFRQQRNIRYILSEGTPLNATIEKSELMPPVRKNIVRRKVTFLLNNLQNVPVKYTTEMNDSQPELNRYDVGRHLTFRIDRSFSRKPYIVPEGIQSKISYRLYIVLLLFIIAVIGYYAVVYQIENHGFGWRFFSAGHPLFYTPLIIAGAAFFIWFVFIKLIGKYFGRGKNNVKMLLTGIKTTAQINSVSQTGLQVNDQPQVKFDITFYDKFSGRHTVQVKKVISLLEAGSAASLQHIDIFYLPEDPSNVLLAEDVE